MKTSTISSLFYRKSTAFWCNTRGKNDVVSQWVIGFIFQKTVIHAKQSSPSSCQLYIDVSDKAQIFSGLNLWYQKYTETGRLHMRKFILSFFL